MQVMATMDMFHENGNRRPFPINGSIRGHGRGLEPRRYSQTVNERIHINVTNGVHHQTLYAALNGGDGHIGQDAPRDPPINNEMEQTFTMNLKIMKCKKTTQTSAPWAHLEEILVNEFFHVNMDQTNNDPYYQMDHECNAAVTHACG
jgi:hypothetical protein